MISFTHNNAATQSINFRTFSLLETLPKKTPTTHVENYIYYHHTNYRTSLTNNEFFALSSVANSDARLPVLRRIGFRQRVIPRTTRKQQRYGSYHSKGCFRCYCGHHCPGPRWICHILHSSRGILQCIPWPSKARIYHSVVRIYRGSSTVRFFTGSTLLISNRNKC